MHIQITRNIRLSVSCGTLSTGTTHLPGDIAEVPDDDGRRMVECGEAIELVETKHYVVVEEEIDGPMKGGKPTKVTVKNKIPAPSTWEPKSEATTEEEPKPDPDPED